MRSRTAAALLVLAGCRAPDPNAIVKASEFETHWAVDSGDAGGTQYIAPVVRFKLSNISGENQGSVQVTATFRRKGEENLTWGSDFRQIASRAEPLVPLQVMPVVLKSDARYYSTGEPGGMFDHADFRDATAEVFVRVGSSPWTRLGALDVERRIGARGVQELGASPAPSAAPGSPASAAPSAGAR
jgi:hypothetical protein